MKDQVLKSLMIKADALIYVSVPDTNTSATTGQKDPNDTNLVCPHCGDIFQRNLLLSLV